MLVLKTMEQFIAAHGAAGGPALFVAMILESACVPVPSEVVLPLAGVLISRGLLTFPGGLAWAVAGQMVGSTVAYAIGFFGGRPLVQRYGGYVLISQERLENARRWLKRYGEVTILVTRMLPGIRTFISLPAGIAAVPFWRFFVYSLLGSIPWTAFLIWVGVRVGQIKPGSTLASAFRIAQVLVVVALALLLVKYLLDGRSARNRRPRQPRSSRLSDPEPLHPTIPGDDPVKQGQERSGHGPGDDRDGRPQDE